MGHICFQDSAHEISRPSHAQFQRYGWCENCDGRMHEGTETKMGGLTDKPKAIPNFEIEPKFLASVVEVNM